MYVQEHESTTVGLMLGLAASYGGTMHPAISKVLIKDNFCDEIDANICSHMLDHSFNVLEN